MDGQSSISYKFDSANGELELILQDAELNCTKAVNYLTVYEVVREQMQCRQHTIERVAQNIIEALHGRFPQIYETECRVTKVAPPLGGKVARVSVTLKMKNEN